MTLTELRAEHPDLFYDQEWFDGEPFMDSEPSGEWVSFEACEVEVNRPFLRAVDLAALYVENPDDSVWRKFLWTDDVDSWGNRVYVAGVGQYGCDGFQIHRKIEPPCYWVRP